MSVSVSELEPQINNDGSRVRVRMSVVKVRVCVCASVRQSRDNGICFEYNSVVQQPVKLFSVQLLSSK